MEAQGTGVGLAACSKADVQDGCALLADAFGTCSLRLQCCTHTGWPCTHLSANSGWLEAKVTAPQDCTSTEALAAEPFLAFRVSAMLQALQPIEASLQLPKKVPLA